MLVFIGLILVYGLLFAILAVSKAILDKDKKPPTSSKSSNTQSNKKPAYTVKTVPEQRRSTVDGRCVDSPAKPQKACSKAGKAFSQVCKAPTDVS